MEKYKFVGKLENWERKESKSGKTYFSFTINSEKFNVFEEEVVKQLKDNMGKIVEVMVAKNENFKNIRKVLKIGGQEEVIEAKETETEIETKYKYMLISYMKDLIIAGKSTAEAIAIIKKALNSF